MYSVIHRSLYVTGDTTIRGCASRQRNALCGEWPVMNGFVEKRGLNALNV